MTKYKPADVAVRGAISFLRENWKNNDGAEGDSIKLVCDELERMRAEQALPSPPAEVTRAHREAIALATLDDGFAMADSVRAWVEGDPGDDTDPIGALTQKNNDALARVIAAREAAAYERGLADRDERCLQSDMQRIRENLARARTEGDDVTALSDWESLRRFVNQEPPLFGTTGVRDPEYPCAEYDARSYDGRGRCLSDGHYECVNCSQLAPNAPRFENDGGRADRLRLYWRRPGAQKGAKS